jgi:integrase
MDFERKLWVIPANRMKMGREHHIPLTEQAISILELVRPISGHRQYVFPSHNDPKLPANRQSANMAIKRMGFKGRLVAHGLRSLASTTLNEQGFDSDVIEVALAHGDKDQIRAAYNRSTYLEKRRIMMQWWSNHIEQAATGNMSLANAK